MGLEASSSLGDGYRREELLPCVGKTHLSEVCPTARASSAGDAAKARAGFSLGPLTFFTRDGIPALMGFLPEFPFSFGSR